MRCICILAFLWMNNMASFEDKVLFDLGNYRRTERACHCFNEVIHFDNTLTKTKAEYELEIIKAYNQGLEDAAKFAEETFVIHEGYAYMLEEKIRELKKGT